MRRTTGLLILLALLLPTGVTARRGVDAGQYEADASNLLPSVMLGMVTVSYELTWSRVAGGGGMISAGEDYTLGGTIGQPESGLLVGGDYTLGGGFWGGGMLVTEWRIYLPLTFRHAPL